MSICLTKNGLSQNKNPREENPRGRLELMFYRDGTIADKAIAAPDSYVKAVRIPISELSLGAGFPLA